MMDEKSKAAGMPEELRIKLTLTLYKLYKEDMPVKDAIEVGKIVVDNYWREKNAGKRNDRKD